MSYGVGIDLGMSFTGAAIGGDGDVRMGTLGEEHVLVPSVVWVNPDGSLGSGEAGQPALTLDPGRTARNFKRRLGDPTPLILAGQPHSAGSLLAATLGSVLRRIAQLQGAAPERVALTYPAVWGPYRREQFTEIPHQAGLDPDTVTILTEPQAACAYFATQQNFAEGDVIAVYDLGGGTFDTSVTRIKKVVPHEVAEIEILGTPEGLEWVGGVDFDEAIMAYVDEAVGGLVGRLDPQDPAAAVALQQIRRECTRAKESLSREESTDISVQLPGHHEGVRLTRSQFEAMIKTPLEATIAALDRTMRSASLTSAELNGVLLIGGSSRIPLVARILSESLGRPVVVDPQPQHCVALGAAVIAGHELVHRAAPSPLAVLRDVASQEDSGFKLDGRWVAAAAGGAVLLSAGAVLGALGLYDAHGGTGARAGTQSMVRLAPPAFVESSQSALASVSASPPAASKVSRTAAAESARPTATAKPPTHRPSRKPSRSKPPRLPSVDLHDGAMLREEHSAPVEVIFGGAKIHVPTSDEVIRLYGGWGNVVVVPDGSLDSVPTVPRDGTILREEHHAEVWLIEGGKKRHITTPDVLNRYGGWSVVHIVPDDSLADFPLGAPID